MVTRTTLVILATLLYSVVADELILVHAIWRHGDRSPTGICSNDPNKRSTWLQGFGQLTQIGMRQHHRLGKMIYDEYVTKRKFLSESYKSDEIYIRSTDVNRTILSAMANTMGMYGNRSAPNGALSPSNPTWPAGFVPVPVHTVAKNTDRVGRPGINCKRDDYLFGLITQCPEVVGYGKQTQELLRNASVTCGENLELFNTWIVTDSWKIEKIHNKSQIFNVSEYEKLSLVDDKVNDFEDAVTLSTWDGVNLHDEVPKVRGGPMLWEIINRLEFKIRCIQPESAALDECKWIKGLKYYAYSVHDDTVSALLSALGAKHALVPVGYPEYSSAVFLELWNSSKGPQIIMRFRANYDAPNFTDVTSSIQGCELQDGYCSFGLFSTRSSPYNPIDIEQLCNDVPTMQSGRKFNYLRMEGVDDLSNEPFKGQRTETPNDGGGQLMLLQTIWRHGDRSPKWLCRSDPHNAMMWNKGFGQLTPRGMSQQRRLGNLIFEEYANTRQFLSKRYEANEIYIRSTDVNRTLLSAVSNLVGMYFNRSDEHAGIDYPSMEGWPHGYVPVPVHTIKRSTDHFSDASICPRRDELMKLIMESPEAVAFTKQNEKVLKQASVICGEELDVLTVFKAVDACTTEAAHNVSCIYPDDLLTEMKRIDAVGQNFRNGKLNTSVIHGVNVTREMARVRGGPLLWDILNRMQDKISCAGDPYQYEYSCRWIEHLRYFAYSGHDSTLQALMSTFADREDVVGSRIPQFAAAIAMELWNTTSGTVVKVKYNPGHSNNTFHDITNTIRGCPKQGPCPFIILVQRSKQYDPVDIDKLCNTPLEDDRSSTVAPSTTTSSASTLRNSLVESHVLIAFGLLFVLGFRKHL